MSRLCLASSVEFWYFGDSCRMSFSRWGFSKSSSSFTAAVDPGSYSITSAFSPRNIYAINFPLVRCKRLEQVCVWYLVPAKDDSWNPPLARHVHTQDRAGCHRFRGYFVCGRVESSTFLGSVAHHHLG